MKAYDYKEAVYNDSLNFIQENFDEIEYKEIGQNYVTDLYDNAFLSDSVTGNASGSYWFNAWKAEEAICHNMYLYKEALEDFGTHDNDFCAETIDVTIRCYLLSECFSRAFEDFVKMNGYTL